MTTLAPPRPEAERAPERAEDVCHVGDRREAGGWVALCGAVVDEGRCCEPGFPACGRDRCRWCQRTGAMP